MTEERVIELGDADWLDEPEPPLGGGIAGHSRLVGLASVVLGCLVSFAGAAPPAAAFTRVGVLPQLEGAYREDRPPIVIAGLVTTAIDGEVFAYHPDGRPAWQSRPVLDPADIPAFYDLAELDGSILLTPITLRGSASGVRSMASESVALDPTTGRERWRIPGAPRRIGDLFMVLEDSGEGTSGARVYRSLPDGLLWTAPQARMIAVDLATDALMTLTDQGLFTEYQLSTGRLRRTAQLRLPHVAPAEHELTMRVFGNRLVLRAASYLSAEPVEQALGYDLATLRPLGPSPLDLLVGLDECGPVLCGFSFRRAYILDRDTLTELWRPEAGESFVWTSGGLLLRSPAPRLVDARTGQIRVDAGGWQPIWHRLRSPREPMPALMTRLIGARTYFARLTLQGIHVLGVAPRELHDCQLQGNLLLCRADDGTWEIWRWD